MNFLNPWALLFGLLAGVIVLMYLLKLRRRHEIVSSTLLWLRSIEDLIANAPFQRLRQNPLMWLQIMTVLLVAAALARPTMWLDSRAGNARIVLIDCSASMGALDGSPEGQRLQTRFDAARAKATQLVGNMRTADQMMLISFGAGASVIQPFTSEKALLSGAINHLGRTDERGNIRDALLIARGVRKVSPNASITILSDGGVGDLAKLVGGNEAIEFIPVGRSDRNVALVAFDIRESFETQGGIEAFAEVENFGSAPAPILLRCLIDNQLVQAREATLTPRARQGFVFSGLQGNGNRLKLELAGNDLLPADNHVEGLIKIDSSLRILLVSSGNFFLERALALLPRVKILRQAPADYHPSEDYQVTVFDNFVPPSLVPGHYLFLNCIPPLAGFAAAPTPVKNQILLDWNRLHPVTRFVNFETLALGDAFKLTVPDWSTVLAESAETPLIAAGEWHGIRLIVAGFDIYGGDWPLQPSFPIFLKNTMHWLSGPGVGGLKTTMHRTAETIAVSALKPVEILDPAGGKWQIIPNTDGLAYFDHASRVGVYEIIRGAQNRESFAVNLLAPEESDIKPAGQLKAGQRQIAGTETRRQNRELWPWVLGCALILLSSEWHWYCRRSWL